MKAARDLTPFPLADVLDHLSGRKPPEIVMTMSEGQWDVWLSTAYDHGFILLELNDDEVPVRAYRKRDVPTFLGNDHD